MGSWHDDCNLLPIHNEWQQTRFSMVAHNCHGKTKNLTAKTKYLTAKPNTSQQKQNSFGFAVVICFCREVFGFCCEVFGFAVRVLVFP